MIKELLLKQEELNALVKQHGNEFTDTSDIVIKYVLAMQGELEEVKNEVNWKWWKQPKGIDEDKLKTEIADVFIFWLDMIRELGYYDILDVVKVKQEENIQRQLGNVEGREEYKNV